MPIYRSIARACRGSALARRSSPSARRSNASANSYFFLTNKVLNTNNLDSLIITFFNSNYFLIKNHHLA